jgi:hypothetical protein
MDIAESSVNSKRRAASSQRAGCNYRCDSRQVKLCFSTVAQPVMKHSRQTTAPVIPYRLINAHERFIG